MRPWPADQPELSDGVVTLRSWRSTDAADVERACQDPDIQHFTQVPVPYRTEDAREFVALGPKRWADGGVASFAVTDGGTGDLIGAISLQQPSEDGREIAVGYWTAPWARRRGSTARALRLLARAALSEWGFTRLVLQAEQANPASNSVARSAGFTRVEGPPDPVELKGTTRWMVTWQLTAEG